MDLPVEVLIIMFSHSTLSDTIEASAVCKTFYYVFGKNKLFVKKLCDSRRLHKDEKCIFSHCYDIFLYFCNDLFVYLQDHIEGEKLFLAKEVLMNRVYSSILPFRVWNLLFMCVRKQCVTDMCKYCTKLYIKNEKISDHIYYELYVKIN